MVNHVYLTAVTKCIHEVAGNVNITLVPWAMSVFESFQEISISGGINKYNNALPPTCYDSELC